MGGEEGKGKERVGRGRERGELRPPPNENPAYATD